MEDLNLQSCYTFCIILTLLFLQTIIIDIKIDYLEKSMLNKIQTTCKILKTK